MSIIKANNVKYRVKIKNENNEVVGHKTILDNINIDIKKGDFVAILGRNGSGKSTFAKHLNALLVPNEGSVLINGQDTSMVEELWKIRKQCGMVFQNPDNQIVGVTVEEDIAFGPENLGMSSEKIIKTVSHAIEKVGMSAFKKKSPNHLSGGQKQRVAIASSLAMKPECIVLDEPTAMLDPKGRKDVINLVRQLNKNDGMTIILITHHMEEAAIADTVIVLDQGKVAISGKPREVFSKIDEMKALKLELPQMMELSYRLHQKGKISRYDLLDIEEFVEQYMKDSPPAIDIYDKIGVHDAGRFGDIMVQSELNRIDEKNNNGKNNNGKTLLELIDVSYVYQPETAMKNIAVDHVNVSIRENEMIGVIGPTGSGKSTLIQLMNGLLRPSEGKIYFKGKDISGKGFQKKQLHFSVGLVFQYPESQLFEETVLSDVMYGPLNKGYEKEKAEAIARECLKSLGIGDEYFRKSPFDLSGGEKRRVAIAGVIAMEPEIIVLDEPTAGLDPLTREHLFYSLKMLKEEKNKTIVIVSHSMEDMAKYVERVIVMNGGKVMFDDTTRRVFQNSDALEKIGLAIPTVSYAMKRLKAEGYTDCDEAITIDEAVDGLSYE